MGFYINPPVMAKEDFLANNGMEISNNDFTRLEFNELNSRNRMAVVLVKNPRFTAALICYAERELKHVQEHPDERPKKYFTVDIKHLKPYLKENS